MYTHGTVSIGLFCCSCKLVPVVEPELVPEEPGAFSDFSVTSGSGFFLVFLDFLNKMTITQTPSSSNIFGEMYYGVILVDQNDFANVINGLKPKSVKGTFTTDDLSELVREMKGLWVANYTGMYNRSCSTASQKASRQCIQMNDVLSLIHETNAVKYEGKPVTSKEEWLNAIIDTGFKMFPGSKPTQYEKVDNQVIRAVKDKKSVAVVLGTGQNINR